MISLRLIHSKLIILLFILCSCSENPEADKLNSSEEVVEVKAKDTIEPYQIDAVTDSLIADFTFRILKGDSSLTLISWGYNKDSIRKFSMGVNSEIRFENKFNFYQDQQDNVFYVNHLTEDTIPVTNRKKRITLVPCSNGYLYMSQGICVNDELEKLLDESELNYSPFPLANMHGKGFSGIYSFKDSKRIREKTDFDILILTRMYGYEYGVETLGYTIKLIDVNGKEEVLSIGDKVIGDSYADIVRHLNISFEKLKEDISKI